MNVFFKKLDPAAIMPVRGTALSAAFDLHALVKQPVEIYPGQTRMIGTGIALDMKQSRGVGNMDQLPICALVLPRSGLGAKHGITIGNTPGLIDADYHGEIVLAVWNRNPVNEHPMARPHTSGLPFVVKPGDRIAQMLFMPHFYVDLLECSTDVEFTSERGAGGFGSTGLSAK